MIGARAQAITTARRALARFDVAVDRLSKSTPARRARFLRRYGITTVLDVGAHVGQYGADLRRFGYRGRIESFEPVPAAYATLQQRCATDPLWRCHDTALAACAGTLGVHVAHNEVSSSALPMLERHVRAAPESFEVGLVEVPCATLDDLGLVDPGRTYLKLDVQGYEREVLEGARKTLPGVVLLEVELSLVPLYAGAPSYQEMLAYLGDRGFRLIWLERGFQDPTSGELLQFDGIFVADGSA